MDQDATWYGGRLRPRRHCVRWGPRYAQKGAQPPIFGPWPLWPNGWTDYDAIWYGGRPRPRRLCVRWGLSSLPQNGGGTDPCPNFRSMSVVATGQTAIWIKMPLGREVGLGPGDIVLDGVPRGAGSSFNTMDPVPSEKGHRPQFSAQVYYGQTDGCDCLSLLTRIT